VPPPAGAAKPRQKLGAPPALEDATLAGAKLVGDGAAGGQIVLSEAARQALLAAGGRGGAAQCLLHMGSHVLVGCMLGPSAPIARRLAPCCCRALVLHALATSHSSNTPCCPWLPRPQKEGKAPAGTDSSASPGAAQPPVVMDLLQAVPPSLLERALHFPPLKTCRQLSPSFFEAPLGEACGGAAAAGAAAAAACSLLLAPGGLAAWRARG
jgi:hypothetical protein